jgi:hypothetical protein
MLTEVNKVLTGASKKSRTKKYQSLALNEADKETS